MTARSRLLLWLFALLGLLASISSAWVHHQLLAVPDYASFCDVNETFSCTSAYLSPYGSMLGIPVAVFGVLWFVVVAMLLAAARPGSPTAENVPGYLLAWSTAGLGVILYLAYGAFFVLRTVCVLCLATYLAVIGIFLISGSTTAYPMSTLPARARRDLRSAFSSPVAIVTLLLLAAGSVSAIAYFAREPQRASFGDTLTASSASSASGPSPASTASGPSAASTAAPAPTATVDVAAPAVPQAAQAPDTLPAEEQAKLENWWNQQQRAIMPVDGGGAAVVIVKFNDYQCPPCRQSYFDYKPILEKYARIAPGKVKLITKHFPLEPECNVNVPQGAHQASCEAAAAVLLSKDKADLIENWLFTNQLSLTPISVRQAAKDVAGIADFDAAYAGALDKVRSDIALGKLLNVGSTPTFFMNGILLRGAFPAPYFDALIALELKKNAR